MNITIVTPTAETSAIGRISRLLREALVTYGHSCTLLSGATSSDNGTASNGHHTEQHIGILATSDIIIYQVGDHYGWHGDMLRWYKTYPGIICLHDFVLEHLWEGYTKNNNYPNGDYEIIDQLRKRTINNTEKNKAEDKKVQPSPLTEMFASFALGVYTHSAWGIRPILENCPGPVWVFPLCHPKRRLPGHKHNAKSVERKDSNIRLLTFGNIIANKQVKQIIESIAADTKLSGQVSYRVVGLIEAEILLRFRQRVAELGLDVIFTGEVSDEALDAELRIADVVIALRWPTLEAGSASVIEALWNGKPTIVTDAGCYRDLPDDVVIKVSPVDQAHQLSTALLSLLNHPEKRYELGIRAQSFATSEFDPHLYGGRVAEFCELVLQKSFAMRAGMAMTRQLGEWGMPIHHDAALNAIAEKLSVFK